MIKKFWKKINNSTKTLGLIVIIFLSWMLYQKINFETLYPGNCGIVPDDRCLGLIMINIESFILVPLLLTFVYAILENIREAKNKKIKKFPLILMFLFLILIKILFFFSTLMASVFGAWFIFLIYIVKYKI